MGAPRKRPLRRVRGKPSPQVDIVVERQLKRRRRIRSICFISAALLTLSVLFSHWGQGGDGDDWARYDRCRVMVVAVSLNGSVTVQLPDGHGETIVRLLGIDLPRAGTPSAAASSRELAARALGLEFVLRLEPVQTRSPDGALLAYFFPSDSDNLNLDMVRDGYAYADRRVQHSLRVQFEQAESDARKKGKGMWKAATNEQMPEWRRQWLDSKDKKHTIRGR